MYPFCSNSGSSARPVRPRLPMVLTSFDRSSSGCASAEVPPTSHTRPPRSAANMRPSLANASASALSQERPSGRLTCASLKPVGTDASQALPLAAASSTDPTNDVQTPTREFVWFIGSFLSSLTGSSEQVCVLLRRHPAPSPEPHKLYAMQNLRHSI